MLVRWSNVSLAFFSCASGDCAVWCEGLSKPLWFALFLKKYGVKTDAGREDKETSDLKPACMPGITVQHFHLI